MKFLTFQSLGLLPTSGVTQRPATRDSVAEHFSVLCSGNVKVHAFCSVCGTPVYLCFVAMPELIAVSAGSLDDPDRFAPQALTYSVRGLEWDAIDPSLPAFERMPSA